MRRRSGGIARRRTILSVKSARSYSCDLHIQSACSVAGVTVLLALLGSVIFGGSDFIAGVTSRRGSPLRVGAVVQSAALVSAVPMALVASWEHVTRADVAWSLSSGVAVAVGLGLFYTGMARGLISLVVPVTAVVAAGIPVVYALVSGEHPGGMTFLGIVLAIAA